VVAAGVGESSEVSWGKRCCDGGTFTSNGESFKCDQGVELPGGTGAITEHVKQGIHAAHSEEGLTLHPNHLLREHRPHHCGIPALACRKLAFFGVCGKPRFQGRQVSGVFQGGCDITCSDLFTKSRGDSHQCLLRMEGKVGQEHSHQRSRELRHIRHLLHHQRYYENPIIL